MLVDFPNLSPMRISSFGHRASNICAALQASSSKPLKVQAYRSPEFRNLRVSTSAFTYIILIQFTQVIFSRMRVAFPELFSCLCESFHDSPPSTEAQARDRAGWQPIDDGGFAGAGYETLGHPA